MLIGIDISSHQGVPDFQQIKGAGYAFVVIKVSGGATYVNPYAPQQIAGAVAAGLLVGLYHYDGEPSIGGGTPEVESANFLGHLPHPLAPNVFLALDCEEVTTRDPARYARFCQLVTQGVNRDVLIYTFHNFITESGLDWSPVADRKLWYAWYPDGVAPGTLTTLTPPAPPAPWTAVTIWQVSGGLTVPGSPNATDVDRFAGDAAGLAALGAQVGVAADATLGLTPVTFPETGQTVQGGFLKTYVDAGGDALARYGYPVTGEMTETVAGEELTVQYFERARFEYHQALNLITFGRVGAELAEVRGYLAAPAPAPAPAPPPPPPPPAPAPAPAPAPQPAPVIVGGDPMTYHSHGVIPLTQPEPHGVPVVDPATGHAGAVYVDVQQDHAFVVWSETAGWLPKQDYTADLPGRWLLGFGVVVHNGTVKALVTSSVAGQTTQDVEAGFIELCPASSL